MFQLEGSEVDLEKAKKIAIYDGKATNFDQLVKDFAGRIRYLGFSEACASLLLIYVNPNEAHHSCFTQGVPAADFSPLFYEKGPDGFLKPFQREEEDREEFNKQYRYCSLTYTIPDKNNKRIPCGLTLVYRADNPKQWILFSLKNTHLPPEKREKNDLQILTSFKPSFKQEPLGCTITEISDISAFAKSTGLEPLSNYLKSIIDKNGLIHRNADIIGLFTRLINVSEDFLYKLYAEFNKEDGVEAAQSMMQAFIKENPDFLDSKALFGLFEVEENLPKILESEALHRIYRHKATTSPRQIGLCMDKENLLYQTLTSVELMSEPKDSRWQLEFILLLEEFDLLKRYDELINENPSFYKLAVLQQHKELLNTCLNSPAGKDILKLFLQNSQNSENPQKKLCELMSILATQNLLDFKNLLAKLKSFSGLSPSQSSLGYKVLLNKPELSSRELKHLLATLPALPLDWGEERLVHCLLTLESFENSEAKIAKNQALCRIQQYKASVSAQQIPSCMDESSTLYNKLTAVQLNDEARLQLDFILLLDELNLLEHYDELLEKYPSFYKLAVLKDQKNLLTTCLSTESGKGILNLFVENSEKALSQLGLLLAKSKLSVFDELLGKMNRISMPSYEMYYVVYSVLMDQPELSLEELSSFTAELQALPEGWDTLIFKEKLAEWLITPAPDRSNKTFLQLKPLKASLTIMLANLKALSSLDKSRTIPYQVRSLLGEKCLANPKDPLLEFASTCEDSQQIKLLYILAELGFDRKELPAFIYAPEVASFLLQASQRGFSAQQLRGLAFNSEYRRALGLLNLCQCAYEAKKITEPCLQVLAAIASWAQDKLSEDSKFADYLANYLTAILAYFEAGDLSQPFQAGSVEQLAKQALPEEWRQGLNELLDYQLALLELNALEVPESVGFQLSHADNQVILRYLRDLQLLSQESIAELFHDGLSYQILKEIRKLENPDWQKASLILLAQGTLECVEWLPLLGRFNEENNLAGILCKLHNEDFSASDLKHMVFDDNLYQSIELLRTFNLDIPFEQLTEPVCRMFADLNVFHKGRPQVPNGYFKQALSFLCTNLPLPKVDDSLQALEPFLDLETEEKKSEIQGLLFSHVLSFNLAEAEKGAQKLVFNNPDHNHNRKMSVILGPSIEENEGFSLDLDSLITQGIKNLDQKFLRSDQLFETALIAFRAIPEAYRLFIPFNLLLEEPLFLAALSNPRIGIENIKSLAGLPPETRNSGLQALRQLDEFLPKTVNDDLTAKLVCSQEAKGHDLRCIFQSLSNRKTYPKDIVLFLAEGINERRMVSSKKIKQLKNSEMCQLSAFLDQRLVLINRLRALELEDKYIDLLCASTKQGVSFRRIVAKVEHECQKLRSRLEKDNPDKYNRLVKDANKPEAEYRKALYKVAYEALTDQKAWPKIKVSHEIKKNAESKICGIVNVDNAPAARKTMQFLTNFLSIVLTLGFANWVKHRRTGTFLFFSGTESQGEINCIDRDVLNLIAPSA